MRTTIELPDKLRQKLVSEAAARHLKGFSTIIVEALEKHFETSKSKRLELIEKLEGSLNGKEYKEEMKRLEEGRKNWRS